MEIINYPSLVPYPLENNVLLLYHNVQQLMVFSVRFLMPVSKKDGPAGGPIYQYFLN